MLRAIDNYRTLYSRLLIDLIIWICRQVCALFEKTITIQVKQEIWFTVLAQVANENGLDDVRIDIVRQIVINGKNISDSMMRYLILQKNKMIGSIKFTLVSLINEL